METQKKFKLVSDYKPTGDQPEAIKSLSDGVEKGLKEQVLLGVTGSGKTFTVANIIQNVQKPTLVLAHNKTLAAQLCSELKEFFPENAVEYFVSYYDYFQPEAYIANTDTYIEKDSSINDEIDKLRHSATSSLFERRDVIIVASVSCIYSLGDPEEYTGMVVSVRQNQKIDRDELLKNLINIQYKRNDIDFKRGTFRVRGDVVEIITANENENGIRIEFFGDEIEKISEINATTGQIKRIVNYAVVFPATHYVASQENIKRAVKDIMDELDERVKYFESKGLLLEAQRISQRTIYDMEMLTEIGFCSGIENYSRVISGRDKGSIPYTLMDYFPKDYLLVVDESHIMLPQVRGMFGGDYSRKKSLIDYGFRLPSAFDNRPLNFEEFNSKINQVIYVSATPSEYERTRSQNIAEQIIRPTGLIDPEVIIKPAVSQIDDLVGEINNTIEKGERVLVTTLTKNMSEKLTEYLQSLDIKVKYMHHDIDTMERMHIIRDLRKGECDVLIGINLLREGLDIPEVSLVAILDADKEGLFRNETSLIQTIGRAARNVNGRVIMYADSVTASIEKALGVTNRRREIQMKYNEDHNIIPQTIKKALRDVIDISSSEAYEHKLDGKRLSKKERDGLIEKLMKEMKNAAKLLEFEHAAYLRDKIDSLKEGKHD